MKAIRELNNEHEGIILMLRILDAVSRKVEAGEQIAMKDLDGITEFLSVFVDKCHHGKEEDHLFPALEMKGIPREGGPIGVMLNEHAKGRGFIADLKAGVADLKAKRDGASEKFTSAARSYIELLTVHIEKENNVLFPMAEERINKTEDDSLIKAFEKLEHDRIGPGKHEEFHQMLARFKKIYLG